MIQALNLDVEKAVRLLVQHFPISQADSRKPILFHDIRVGVYLYERDYSYEVVLGGLLHDSLEWSDISEQELRNEFGNAVTNIVVANTKNRSIDDSLEQIQDLVRRCVECGQDALIVKAADTLDSLKHYTQTKNKKELEYCRKNVGTILRYKLSTWKDPIFNELR